MKNIFLVEDDQGIRELIEYLLISREYDVQSFSTVKEFQYGLLHEIPDLILLDIMLPDGNGLQLCRDLKQDSKKEHIPVLLMSAHEKPEKARKVGAEDFIAEPFDIEDLFRKIHRCIVN